MPSEISGTKMAIEIRNLTSNRTETQEQRKVDRSVEKTESKNLVSDSKSSVVRDDTVVLSSKAQQVQSIIANISEPPASDSNRIEALRNAINSGNYSVSAERIASKLLTIDFGNRNQSE